MIVTDDAALAPNDANWDSHALDLEVRPQDDFYRYVNGRWTDAFVLPGHRAEVTLLNQLAEKVQGDVVGVIQAAAGETHRTDSASGRQIGDLYASFMDEDAIEAGQAWTLAADLTAIDCAGNHEDLAYLMGRLQACGVAGAMQVSVDADVLQARGYLLVLTQSGLGLPSADHYRRGEDQPLRESYRAHIETMLKLGGVPAPRESADTALLMETQLAAAHAAPGAAGRLTAPAHACTAAELAQRTGGFPWAVWLRGLGAIPENAAVRIHPAAFLDALDTWWRQSDLRHLKAWLAWRYLHEMAPFGASEVFTENFRFYGQTLTGSTSPRPRWMRATSFVQTLLGDAVGERYLRQHLAPGSIEQAEQLVESLVLAYRARLERTRWMAPATRAAALDKLDRMTFEIGFPQHGHSEQDLRVDRADLIGNVKRGRALALSRQLARLGGPLDRADWKVNAQTPTAYYRNSLNQVVIPAALLQPPLFDAVGSLVRNFALLGTIVAHEMSHAFDAGGSRFDGSGRVRDWWAPQDRAEYTRRTALLVRHYDQFAPAGPAGPHLSGARTLGENIADIAGLTVAHHALSHHPDLAALEPAERQREQRRFFLLWATLWRAKRTPGRLLERLANDRHAPAECRCNGAVSHVDGFYQAFDVLECDALYLPPEARFELV